MRSIGGFIVLLLIMLMPFACSAAAPEPAPRASDAAPKAEPESYWIAFTKQMEMDSTAGTDTIDKLAGMLDADRHATVILIGQSGDTGSHEYCLASAAKMALAVKEALISKGVAETQIRTHPLGREQETTRKCVASECQKIGNGVEAHYSG